MTDEDLRRWVDATGADEDVRERAFAMLSRTLPTPEQIERLEAAGWAPSRLGAGWYTRGASEPGTVHSQIWQLAL